MDHREAAQQAIRDYEQRLDTIWSDTVFELANKLNITEEEAEQLLEEAT